MQILHVQVDAVAHHEHQDDAADERESEADRVTAKFQRLAARIAEHAAGIEEFPPPVKAGINYHRLDRRGSDRPFGIRRFCHRLTGDCILEVADKGVFQRIDAARLCQSHQAYRWPAPDRRASARCGRSVPPRS